MTKTELIEYATALHEAAHAFVAHQSRLFKVNDPAVSFPPASTGHLARAHFGPKVMVPTMTTDHVREFVIIGAAGLYGQCLVGERTLLQVYESVAAGCDDDFEAIREKLLAVRLEDELEALTKKSEQLVTGNRDTIMRLADVIYYSKGNVSQAEVLAVFDPSQPPAPAPRRGILARLLGRLRITK